MANEHVDDNNKNDNNDDNDDNDDNSNNVPSQDAVFVWMDDSNHK